MEHQRGSRGRPEGGETAWLKSSEKSSLELAPMQGAFSRFPTVRGDKPAPAFPHSQPFYHPSEGNTCEATGKSQSFSRT